jgi:hypothetical protein
MEQVMSYYVRMTDKFMSGWGMAKGKRNVMVVICDTYEQAEQIEKAANRRPEMKRVAICSTKPKARPGILYSWKVYADMGGPWLE